MSFNFEKRKLIKDQIIESIGRHSYGTEHIFSPIKFAKDNALSVQTVYRYLEQLENEGVVEINRSNKNCLYRLIDKVYKFSYSLKDNLTEDIIWQKNIRPTLADVADNVYKICDYIFTEMLNNAIEHSEGTIIEITIINNSYRIFIAIMDNGIGIFNKIAEAMNFEEKSFALLELAKGKFSTDNKRHTGEGIFFSSRMTDFFYILSEELIFTSQYLNGGGADSKGHNVKQLLHIENENIEGTLVAFSIPHRYELTIKEIFDEYSDVASDDYGFIKTTVPVKLLEYGNDVATFISRSQAKRLIARFEKFKIINLDFSGIDEIGQGFADEIFRVFANLHPECELIAINCNEYVFKMINRAKYSA